MLAAICQETEAQQGRAKFELTTVPVPGIEGLPPGSVLIRSVAASICGSDLWGSGGCGCSPEWRKPIDYLVRKQQSIGGGGHEVIGEVVAMVPSDSQAVRTFHGPAGPLREGDVVLAMVTSYIQAVSTVRVLFEEETSVSADVLPQQGAFAEYFVSHAVACLSLPPAATSRVPHAHYVAAQPLGTVLHAVSKLGTVVGKKVAVVGQGQNGLLFTAVLRNMGARQVIALDLLPERLRAADAMGATSTVQVGVGDKDKDDAVAEIAGSCDFAIDVVGHQGRTMDLCASLARDDGTVLVFGLPPAAEHDAMQIRFGDFVRNVRFVCSHSPGMDRFAHAIELVQRGDIDLEPLFTHTFPFRSFPTAFDLASEYRDGVIKVIVSFDE